MGIALLGKLCSLFLIMLAGYVIVRCGLLRSEDSHTLSVLCLYLICPCSIISAFQIESNPSIVSGLLLCLTAAVVIHAAFIIIVTLLKKPLKLDGVEQASIIYTNAGNLIIPIVSSLLGPEWVIYTCAYICVQVPLQWSHCKSIICNEHHMDLKKILTNVNMISVFVGVILFFTGLKLPDFVQSTIDTVGSTIGPVSMLVVGMLIGGMDLKDIFLRRRTWLITAMRLVVMPLITVLFLRIGASHSSLPDAGKVLLITLLAAAAPAGATVTQMAQVYGANEHGACSINVLSTLLCIVTMPLIVAIYQM